MNDQNDHDEGDSGIDAVRMGEERAVKILIAKRRISIQSKRITIAVQVNR